MDSIGFYDKNGKELFQNDTVKAAVEHSTTLYSSKGRKIEVMHLFQIIKSKRAPEYYLKDLGPEKPLVKPIPDSYCHTLLPRFEAYPQDMFFLVDGKLANSWHYKRIEHLPEEVRYKSMPDIEKVEK